jgi:hypothetical protein
MKRICNISRRFGWLILGVKVVQSDESYHSGEEWRESPMSLASLPLKRANEFIPVSSWVSRELLEMAKKPENLQFSCLLSDLTRGHISPLEKIPHSESVSANQVRPVWKTYHHMIQQLTI